MIKLDFSSLVINRANFTLITVISGIFYVVADLFAFKARASPEGHSREFLGQHKALCQPLDPIVSKYAIIMKMK